MQILMTWGVAVWGNSPPLSFTHTQTHTLESLFMHSVFVYCAVDLFTGTGLPSVSAENLFLNLSWTTKPADNSIRRLGS